jgi:hypothetical protein
LINLRFQIASKEVFFWKRTILNTKLRFCQTLNCISFIFLVSFKWQKFVSFEKKNLVCSDSHKPCRDKTYKKFRILHVFGQLEAVSNRTYRKINSPHVSGMPEAMSRQNLQEVYFSSCVWTNGFPVQTDVTKSLLSLLCSDAVITYSDAVA